MPAAIAADAATLPSLGAVRNAPTATLERPDPTPRPGAHPAAALPPDTAYPPPSPAPGVAYPAASLPPGAAAPAASLPLDAPRRSGRLLLAGAILVVAALASFAVVSAMTGRDASRGAGAGSQLVAVAPDAAGPDAASAMTPPPPPPPSPPDGAPPAVPPPIDPPQSAAAPTAACPPVAPATSCSPGAPRKRPPPAPVKMGKIFVPGYPSLAIFWGGKKIGESPGYAALPVGTHTITLQSQGAEANYPPRSFSVTNRENEITTVPR
jgi:hypothetical protein